MTGKMFKKIHRNGAMDSLGSNRPSRLVFFRLRAFLPAAGLVLAASLSAGCKTVPAPAPVDFAKSGWNVQHGQAVWKANKDAPELAAEILIAMHSSEGMVIELTKTPFPLVIARVGPSGWRMEFVADKRVVQGAGAPPSRLPWPRSRVPLAVLQLPRLLGRQSAPRDWKFSSPESNRFRIENTSTHETLEGFLEPASRTENFRPAEAQVLSGQPYREAATFLLTTDTGIEVPRLGEDVTLRLPASR